MSSQPPPQSSPPPRFTSGGGYHEVNIGYDNTIFPMRENDGQQQQQEYHHCHYEQQQQEHMMDNLTHEAQLQHKIAQSMLTPRANNNNNTTINEDEALFGMDDVPISYMNPPPWEETIQDHHHHGGGGGAAQFPAMTQFPTSDVINDHNIDMVNEPEVQPEQVETTAHTNNSISNSNGPSSTKSVTFNTHDEFHSIDIQLDQLLHVDEEFFNVAHFLLEVVNVGSVVNFDDENIGRFEEEEVEEGHYGGGGVAQAVVQENDGIGSILSRFFTFECGNTQDVDSNEYGPSQHQMRNNNNSSNSLGGEKKYKLTKKLVQDFEKALKFRMENIESNESLLMGGGMESELIKRTREIADRVEKYGLPGMPSLVDERIPEQQEQQQQQQPYEERYDGVGREDVANEPAAYGDCYDAGYDEVEEEFLRTLDASKVEGKAKPGHFPIIPTDDDDEDWLGGGMNENERRFYNTFGNLSTNIKETQKRNSQSPFKSVCKLFSTLVGPSKSSTPSIEACQIRLRQIRREMSNAERMMESSRSNDVISACANRIKRLKDEERMYQIFKEISKIQAMMQATESESVKKACSQRLYQLSAELNSIDLGQYDEGLDINDDVVGLDARPVAKATGGEDLDWYARAQRYVRTQEEPPNPFRSSSLHTAAAHQHYRPHQYSQQYDPHPGYIPDAENYYDRPYPTKQQFASPISPRRVLSPRNGRPYPQY